MLNYKIAKRAKKDGRFYLYISINCLTDDTWVCQTLLRNMRRMNASAFKKNCREGVRDMVAQRRGRRAEEEYPEKGLIGSADPVNLRKASVTY